MKTLKEITREFVVEVKKVLDKATWRWESSGHFKDESGVEKACIYLDRQRFSVKKVEEHLKDHWETIVELIRDDEVREDKPAFAAAIIANNVAFDRISPYTWTNRYESFSDKWYIDESISFKIN